MSESTDQALEEEKCVQHVESEPLTLNELSLDGQVISEPKGFYHDLNARECLPVLIPEGYRFGVWQILKNVIGKDITKISMPIPMNEPISFLQRYAE